MLGSLHSNQIKVSNAYCDCKCNKTIFNSRQTKSVQRPCLFWMHYKCMNAERLLCQLLYRIQHSLYAIYYSSWFHTRLEQLYLNVYVYAITQINLTNKNTDQDKTLANRNLKQEKDPSILQPKLWQLRISFHCKQNKSTKTNRISEFSEYVKLNYI